MEFSHYAPMAQSDQEVLVKDYQEATQKKKAKA